MIIICFSDLCTSIYKPKHFCSKISSNKRRTYISCQKKLHDYKCHYVDWYQRKLYYLPLGLFIINRLSTASSLATNGKHFNLYCMIFLPRILTTGFAVIHNDWLNVCKRHSCWVAKKDAHNLLCTIICSSSASTFRFEHTMYWTCYVIHWYQEYSFLIS